MTAKKSFMIERLKRFGHWVREALRDQLAESNALRWKKLEVYQTFHDAQEAQRKGDYTNYSDLKAKHAALVAEWERMAVSYENRFLLTRSGKGAP